MRNIKKSTALFLVLFLIVSSFQAVPALTAQLQPETAAEWILPESEEATEGALIEDAPATESEGQRGNNETGATSASAIQAAVMDIQTARQQPVGTPVTVEGVVTRIIASSAGSQNNGTVFIQDGEAGIGIYKSYTFSGDSYEPGQRLTVTGTIDIYNGLKEIIVANLTDIAEGNLETEPEPLHISVSELMNGDDDEYQGQFVKIEGAVLTSIGTNSNHIINQDGVTTTLRNTGASTLTKFNVNDIIDVQGIAGVYGGANQLLVQNEDDITDHQADGKEQLNALIGTAETKYANAEVGTEPNQYPAEAKSAFRAAIDAAIAVYNDSEATQEQVNAATAALLAAIAEFEASVNIGQISIGEARNKAVGTEVFVKGVVTKIIASSAGNQNNGTVFIQDGTAGIGVYKSNSFNSSSFTEGETVTAKGTIDIYNGLVEIQVTDLEDIAEDAVNPLPPAEAELVTVGDILNDDGSLQGQLVKVDGAQLTSVATNSNHTISQDGFTATLRNTGDSTLHNFNVNDLIDAEGIVGTYGGEGQLLVQNETDITPHVAAGKDELEAAIILAYSKLEGIEVGTEPGQYPQEAYAAFEAAIGAAEAVYDDAGATQEAIDNATAALLAAIAEFETSVNIGQIPISEARNKTVGTEVVVKGTVTRIIASSAGNQNNGTIFIQDSTGGIGVYKSTSFNPDSYAPGTVITVKGTIDIYNGLVEVNVADLTDITEEPGDVVQPEVISIVELGQYQGQLVKIEGATLTAVASNSNHTITKDGVTTTMRCTGASTLTGFAVGDTIDVTGIAGIYGSSFQILVKNQDDITK